MEISYTFKKMIKFADEDTGSKPEVNFYEEPIKFICNEAFHGVKRILPKGIRDTERHDRRLAKVLGILGGYGTACSGKLALELINRISPIPQQDHMNLENAVYLGTGTVIGTFFLPRYMMRKQHTEWLEQNPTYATGAYGVAIGALLKAGRELVRIRYGV